MAPLREAALRLSARLSSHFVGDAALADLDAEESLKRARVAEALSYRGETLQRAAAA